LLHSPYQKFKKPNYYLTMKKLFTLFLSSAVALGVFAQSPRIVLLEEFSGENCGPCAGINPTITAFADANPSNLLLFKYQSPIPSAGPIYNQNTSDVQARLTYYSCNFAPWIQEDGLDPTPNTAGNDENNPFNYFDNGGNSAEFTQRAAVTSPVAVTVSHIFSADFDSCYVTVSLNFTQAYNAAGNNSLKLRLAMVEKLMEYATPPGTNGETEFHNVMRKMYPNPAGTTMPNTNAVGTQTFNFGMPIPAYIKSKGQIAFIAFLQDDTGKEVLNANISTQQLLSLDAEATDASIPTYVTCSNSITGAINFKNLGSATLTSGDLVVKVNGTTNSTTPWTGNVVTGDVFQPTVPAITGLTAGNNTIEISLANPNGGTDNDAANNAKTFTVVYNTSASAAAPFVQDFESLFPGPDAYVYNPDGAATFSQGAAGSSGTKSLKMDYYNSAVGAVDHFYLPRVDLTGSQVAWMTFQRAAAQYGTTSNNNDRLEIQVSKDCGTTWYTVWDKAGANLATTNATTTSFVPVANQWVADSANITLGANEANVMIRFKATSDYGNNAYIDQINIYKRNAGVGINDLTNISALNVYPNPATDVLNIDYTMGKTEPVTINIVNAVGQVVYNNTNQTPATINNVRVDVSGLAKGVYFVNVTSESGKATYKFSAQ
jgi:hypothetical protein